MKYKPTADDLRIIRKCAELDAGYGKVEICPSTKNNMVDRSKEDNMNILLVTNDPVDLMMTVDHNCSDCDLADNAFIWGDFTKGVELTEDGKGIFDFYVYGPLGYNKELQTNVTAYYDGGKLVRVDGVPNVRWQAGVFK
jgi:hypothetical protein